MEMEVDLGESNQRSVSEAKLTETIQDLSGDKLAELIGFTKRFRSDLFRCHILRQFHISSQR